MLVHLYENQLLDIMGGPCALSATLLFLAAKSSENCRSVDEVVLSLISFFRSQGSVLEDVGNEVCKLEVPHFSYCLDIKLVDSRLYDL